MPEAVSEVYQRAVTELEFTRSGIRPVYTKPSAFLWVLSLLHQAVCVRWTLYSAHRSIPYVYAEFSRGDPFQKSGSCLQNSSRLGWCLRRCRISGQLGFMISFLDLQCAGRDRSGSHDLNCKLQLRNSPAVSILATAAPRLPVSSSLTACTAPRR